MSDGGIVGGGFVGGFFVMDPRERECYSVYMCGVRESVYVCGA